MEKKKPPWLKVSFKREKSMKKVEELLQDFSLNTVCDSANCPNRGECFNRQTATFMIMGKICSRSCSFCAVQSGDPVCLDPEEPLRVAKAVKKLKLEHVVITSVTRDDLFDGGAGHFAKVIEKIKKTTSNTTVEVLIPDFKGSIFALKKIISQKPKIINHNIETVPDLYSQVRPEADYNRSLQLLARIKQITSDIITKSGIMLGLGETKNQVIQVLKDLRKIDCDVLTIGQYLRPSPKHCEIEEYIHPDKFEEYKRIGEKMGFKKVYSAPLVRSSYRAEEVLG